VLFVRSRVRGDIRRDVCGGEAHAAEHTHRRRVYDAVVYSLYVQPFSLEKKKKEKTRGGSGDMNERLTDLFCFV